MVPILLLVLSCLPNSPLANAHHSFRSLRLPSPGCEAYAFDSDNGGPYTGLNDGRIVKYEGPNTGFVEYATTVYNRSNKLCDGTHGDLETGKLCGRPLDMEFNHKTGELYVVDVIQGLMVVAPGGGVAVPVAPGQDGMPLDAPDAVAIDPITDEVYFTDVGTIIFTNNNMTQILLSGDRSGRLLKYDPKTKLRTVVLTGLAAPAGVAVSRDGSFVLIAEYLACQITRLWLTGPKANSTELFAHLPGNPDNIKRTESGDFWVPVNIQKLYPTLTSFPLGQKMNPRGQIIETVNFYAEYNATYITEVHEHLGSMYVASVYTGIVGVYRGLSC